MATLSRPRTALVGRSADLVVALDLLRQDDVALLTLTGAGGSGKTRLALELAERARAEFPGGVVIVALAPVSDPALVPEVIARAFDLSLAPGDAISALAQAIGGQRVLLVVDNFEQVVLAGPVFVELLSECPALTVLVTSRQALRVTGEYELPVLPLQLPERGRRLPLDILRTYGAIELFCARAAAVDPSFRLTPDNAAAVAAVCHGLDGLPLALELAAARVKVLPPAELLSRLESSLSLLTGGARDLPARQRTMRDTVAWSYDLLEPGERRLFAQLGVFVDGFRLDGAEAVCGSTAIEGVESLLEKNLLTRSYSERLVPRFTMLETVRAHALEHLDRLDDAEDARRAHARYVVAIAESARWMRAGFSDALERLHAEAANVRAALDWSRSRGEVEIAARIVAATAWGWIQARQAIQFRALADDLLARTADRGVDPLRAGLLFGAGLIAYDQYDIPAARRWHAESREMWEQLGDVSRLAWATLYWGYCTWLGDDGDPVRGRELLEASIALFESLPDRWGVAFALTRFGQIAHATGDVAGACKTQRRAAADFLSEGDFAGSASATGYLVDACTDLGDLVSSGRALLEGIALRERDGRPSPLGENAAGVALAMGQAARAARVFGSTLARGGGGGIAVRFNPGARWLRERQLAAMRRLLGEDAFERELAAGAALSLVGAIAESVAIAHEAIAWQPRAGGPGLTSRETEVLALLARGATNAEIAARLVLSVRTVERHVANVYAKIDARNRAEAAAYAVGHGLAGATA